MSKDKESSKTENTEPKVDIKVTGNSDDDKSKTAGKTTDIKESSEYRELNDRYIRLIAEFDNFKKRSAKEYNRLIETAESNLITDLLTVVDDFNRALNHETDDVKTFKQGVEMINSKLMETLERRGLKHMKVIDEEFDPNFHEAVMQVEVDGKEDDIIVEEVQAGYYLNDKVIRPAKVVVAKKKVSDTERE